MTEISNTTWEGRDIRLSYTPRWCAQIDHVEVQSVDRTPLHQRTRGRRLLRFLRKQIKPAPTPQRRSHGHS